MKKILYLLNVIICMIALCITVQATGVLIDGIPVQFTDSGGYPFIENSRTLVPLRATMESFGAEVLWEAQTQTAIVKKDSTTVRCRIGENCIYRNNVKIENDAASVIVGGRTYLPIRAVLEAFGAEVSWDGNVNVISPGGEAYIYEVENTPSVTKNYWKIWTGALEKKNAGDYTGAIKDITSIANIFLKENTNASRAMLFKHLGECHSYLKDYTKASSCFKREGYYWSNEPGMEQSRIDAVRRSNLIKTNTQIYVKSFDKAMGGRIDFGTVYEPDGGIYLGAYTEGDTNIYNPYDPNKFYMDTYPDLIEKDVECYLLYLPYGMDISNYNSHIHKAIEKDKIMQIALEPHRGLDAVNNYDGYLVALAEHMENSGAKMMLRFAGEMNDTTSEWFSTDTELYKEKFRMVADIFHTYAPSVPIIYAPNFYPSDTIDDYYPGDEYVDYVGISSYMMHQPITDPLGKGVDRSRWSSQLDVIYSLYGHKKPIIVVEGGASYMDYDTWADITPFASRQLKDFYTYLPIKYPNVKFAFIFNSDRERQKFSLSNNPTYLAAYKEGTSSDLYVTSENSAYSYDYYELGNNVKVKAEQTELACFVSTPSNDTAYVIYYINGVQLGVVYSAPYCVPVNFAGFEGQKVNVTVKAFNADNILVTDYTVKVIVE